MDQYFYKSTLQSSATTVSSSTTTTISTTTTTRSGYYNDQDDYEKNGTRYVSEDEDERDRDTSLDSSDEEGESSSFSSYDYYDDDEEEDDTPKLSFGAKLLAKQGYVEGEGLGKDRDGRVDIIQVDKLQSTKGLGFIEKELPQFYTVQKHDLQDEDLDFPHQQIINWIQSASSGTLELNENQIVIGNSSDCPRRGHCSVELMLELDEHKSALDHLEKRLFLQARKKSNPYEAIKGSIFINRAAVKMANIDKLSNLLLPLIPTQGKPKSFIYFADVCAGPGGFTEYVYWKKTNGGRLLEESNLELDDIVKGFGFTIRGKCDWNLEKFSKQIPIYNFKKEYGYDGTGNILNSLNIKNFSSNIQQYTNGVGLHLFMADGGISTEGKENQQENILSQLILCQILAMFETLGRGGNFVCKIFDTFTPFTIGLLYLVYQHFETFSICKPYTSRPLNSERYIIAKNYSTYRPQSVIEFLYAVNEKMNNKVLVLELISISSMDSAFIDYIRMTNSDICSRQIKAFKLFKKYIEDKDLPTCDQIDLKNKCLEEWELPKESKFDIENYLNNKKKKRFINNNNNNNNNNNINNSNNKSNKINQNYQRNNQNKNYNTNGNSSGNNSNLSSPNNSLSSPNSPQFSSTSPYSSPSHNNNNNNNNNYNNNNNNNNYNNNSYSNNNNKGRRFINNKQLLKPNSQFHHKPPPINKHPSPLQIQQQFLIQQQKEQNQLLEQQHQLQSTTSDIQAASFMENLLKRMQETRVNNNNNDDSNNNL